MHQLLVFVCSVGFMLLWTLGWGILATGSARAGLRYLRTWLGVIGLTLFAGGVCFLIVWQFIGPR